MGTVDLSVFKRFAFFFADGLFAVGVFTGTAEAGHLSENAADYRTDNGRYEPFEGEVCQREGVDFFNEATHGIAALHLREQVDGFDDADRACTDDAADEDAVVFDLEIKDRCEDQEDNDGEDSREYGNGDVDDAFDAD